MMLQAIFCETDGSVCPTCSKGNTDLIASEHGEYSGRHEHWRRWKCRDCGTAYAAVYAIAGYSLDHVPEYEKPYRTCLPLSTTVLAVATPGAVDDWGVYVGVVPGECHRDEIDQVVHNGTKQLKSVAVLLFPQFDPKKYRD